MHGLALAAHRLWQNLGFKMNKVLAWILTFNFVNLAWVFFRAESFKQGMDVIKAMTGLNGITLPEKVKFKLDFLATHGVQFGNWLPGTQASSHSVILIALAFLIVLVLKPTVEFSTHRKPSAWLMLFAAFLFCYSFISTLTSSSEVFLYFNF
jgi:hypothetical protein